MADRLTMAQSIAAAAGLLFSAGSTAQALTDPTRPPLELMAAAAGVDKATGEGAAAHPRLESILLSSGRKGAMINGEYVALGGKYGKAVLVEISATEVKLKAGKDVEVLRLYAPGNKPAAAPDAGERSEKMVKRP